MDLEKVNKKKEDLLAAKEQQVQLQTKFIQALEETRANLNRIDGGILDCEYWIKELTLKEEKPEELGSVIEEQKMEAVD
jgi:hypothetical protein